MAQQPFCRTMKVSTLSGVQPSFLRLVRLIEARLSGDESCFVRLALAAGVARNSA